MALPSLELGPACYSKDLVFTCLANLHSAGVEQLLKEFIVVGLLSLLLMVYDVYYLTVFYYARMPLV